MKRANIIQIDSCTLLGAMYVKKCYTGQGEHVFVMFVPQNF